MAVTNVSVKFIYQYCRDLEAMRAFYVELLGMTLGSYKNEPGMAWLSCKCDGLEFIVMPSKDAPAPPPGWAEQPGWEGGTLPCMSCSVEVPEAQFAATVQRLQAAACEAKFSQPQWCQDSYWSFPVKDPGGNTVEVYCSLAQRPDSTEWPA